MPMACALVAHVLPLRAMVRAPEATCLARDSPRPCLPCRVFESPPRDVVWWCSLTRLMVHMFVWILGLQMACTMATKPTPTAVVCARDVQQDLSVRSPQTACPACAGRRCASTPHATTVCSMATSRTWTVAAQPGTQSPSHLTSAAASQMLPRHRGVLPASAARVMGTAASLTPTVVSFQPHHRAATAPGVHKARHVCKTRSARRAFAWMASVHPLTASTESKTTRKRVGVHVLQYITVCRCIVGLSLSLCGRCKGSLVAVSSCSFPWLCCCVPSLALVQVSTAGAAIADAVTWARVVQSVRTAVVLLCVQPRPVL